MVSSENNLVLRGIKKRGIKLVKIATVDQLGEMFTKSLPRAAVFEHLWQKLMGW